MMEWNCSIPTSWDGSNPGLEKVAKAAGPECIMPYQQPLRLMRIKVQRFIYYC
jgi:hypothetical protein